MRTHPHPFVRESMRRKSENGSSTGKEKTWITLSYYTFGFFLSVFLQSLNSDAVSCRWRANRRTKAAWVSSRILFSRLQIFCCTSEKHVRMFGVCLDSESRIFWLRLWRTSSTMLTFFKYFFQCKFEIAERSTNGCLIELRSAFSKNITTELWR